MVNALLYFTDESYLFSLILIWLLMIIIVDNLRWFKELMNEYTNHNLLEYKTLNIFNYNFIFNWNYFKTFIYKNYWIKLFLKSLGMLINILHTIYFYSLNKV